MSEKKKEMPLMLFGTRPEFAGKRLEPLTAGRVLVLEKRGNPIVAGLKKGQTITSDDLLEVLLVVWMDDRDLAEFCVDADDREWRVKAAEVSMGLSPEDFGDLWSLIEKEKEEIEKARAVPKKKRARNGKKKATRRTGG